MEVEVRVDRLGATRHNRRMIQKVVFTLLAVAVVWFAFRYWDRMIRQRPGERPLPRGQARGSSSPARGKGGAEVFETEQCPVCGSYVPASGAADCGRPDCPYGG